MSRLTPVATPVSTYILPAVKRPEQAQLGPGPQAPLQGPSQAAQLSEAAQQLAAVAFDPVSHRSIRFCYAHL